MGQPTLENGAPAGIASAPDSTTADLLAKHSAGEKLSQSEYGKLGAFKRKMSSLFGKAGAPAQPAQPGPGPGDAARMAAVAPAQASPGELPLVPVDAGIARRTAAAILNRTDAITVRWIENHARRAGAAGSTLDRFRASAALSQDDRALLTELAPDIMAELELDPRKAPLWTALGILGLHTTNLWLAVDELKALQKERAGNAPKAAPTPPAASTSPVTCTPLDRLT